DALGDDAGVQTEQEDADRAEGRGESDVERRVGQGEDQPPLADILHPRADERDALTDEEEAEIAMTERPEPVAPVAPPAPRDFGHCGKGRERMTLWVDT